MLAQYSFNLEIFRFNTSADPRGRLYYYCISI